MSAVRVIALIGFGEVGQVLCDDLLAQGGVRVRAWDTAFADPASGPSAAARARAVGAEGPAGVLATPSSAAAVAGADLVISAVTADQTLLAAETAAAAIGPQAFFLDLNSSSPGRKIDAAAAIDAAGGRYVEAAVMSPIGPKRIASPMLLGGAHTAAFLAAADGLGFAGARPYADLVGRAAATKLCRSVMIKGIEALLTESMLAARHYGVEQVVLDSLSDLLPLPDWPAKAQYMISRSVEHGVRRAEEMREAARTMAEAGVDPLMSRAIAERQDWAALHRDALSPDLAAMLDAVIAQRNAA